MIFRPIEILLKFYFDGLLDSLINLNNIIYVNN